MSNKGDLSQIDQQDRKGAKDIFAWSDRRSSLNMKRKNRGISMVLQSGDKSYRHLPFLHQNLRFLQIETV